MLNNYVTLTVGTKKLTGWKNVTINRALDALADTFTFEMVNIWKDEDSPLLPSEICEIHIENDTGAKELVLTGYIDNVNIDIDHNLSRVKVNGRSKTGDIVDCSAENIPSNSWNNTPLVKIIRDLLYLYNVDLDFVSSAVSNLNSKLNLSINTGESIYEIIERECRKRAVLPVTNPNGNIELITTGDRITEDKLILGQNILKASVSYDYSNRFGNYKIKTQKQNKGDAWSNSVNTIFAESTDTVFGDNRYRKKIIVMDGAGNLNDCKSAVNWEAQIRAGKTGKLSLTLPTWFKSDNTLWEVGTLVYCKIAELKIDEQLLINNIEFSQDNSTGTVCRMELVNKDTYSKEPSKTVKITENSKKNGFGKGW